ncbi:MAG: hypothetical protein GXP26_12815 [Planctomycetes bacterium]|nr:hypothetical protein [Planctomycetota bacterium]
MSYFPFLVRHVPCASFFQKFFLALLLPFGMCCHSRGAEIWLDVTGRHSIEADFVALKDDAVVLRQSNGTQIEVPISKLAEDSRRRAELLGGKEKLPNVELNLPDAEELEAEAKKIRSAVQALALYEIYLAQERLAPQQRLKAEKRVSKWRERAEKKLWRWGGRWLPIKEIQKDLDSEEQLLREAHRMIEIGNDKLARERFEKASNQNPEGIRGDFYLGLLHALVGRNASLAEKRFSRCVQKLERNPDELNGLRRANLIAALNNRAICRVRLGRHSQAMRGFNKALELAPMTPELVQNLGYYGRIASLFSGWKVSSSVARRIAEQYARVSVANQSAAFQENVGWLFIPYVDAPLLPALEKVQLVDDDELPEERLKDGNTGVERDLRVVAWATGVAVDEQHLVTALASVQGAYGLWTTKSGKLRRDMPGRVVAISPEYDLALLRYHGLQAQPLTIARQGANRATKYWTASYAEPGILGSGIQVVEGTVLNIKTSGAEYISRLVCDTSLNLGSEGTPLLDKQGSILGIDIGNTHLAKSLGGRRLAISATEVRSLLTSTGKEFAAMDRVPTKNIEDIEEFARACADSSVFQIAVVGRVPRLSWTERIGEIRGLTTKEGWNAFEDAWCMRCNGQGTILCTQKGCKKGQVSHKEQYIAGYLPATEQPIPKTRVVFEKCRKCSGKGVIKCTHCRGRKREPSI